MLCASGEAVIGDGLGFTIIGCNTAIIHSTETVSGKFGRFELL